MNCVVIKFNSKSMKDFLKILGINNCLLLIFIIVPIQFCKKLLDASEFWKHEKCMERIAEKLV